MSPLFIHLQIFMGVSQIILLSIHQERRLTQQSQERERGRKGRKEREEIRKVYYLLQKRPKRGKNAFKIYYCNIILACYGLMFSPLSLLLLTNGNSHRRSYRTFNLFLNSIKVDANTQQNTPSPHLQGLLLAIIIMFFRRLFIISEI